MLNFWNGFVPWFWFWITTWYYRGVGQMTMFDHEGGGGVKISENLTTWYIDAP